MNLRIFQTRLSDQHFLADQDAINQFMAQVNVKKTSTQFVPAEPDYWSILVFYENGKSPKPAQKNPAKVTTAETGELTEDQKEILSALKTWRKDKANALNLPDFMICHNASLLALTQRKPRSLAELSEIKGFGDAKISRHGEEILSVINAF